MYALHYDISEHVAFGHERRNEPAILKGVL